MHANARGLRDQALQREQAAAAPHANRLSVGQRLAQHLRALGDQPLFPGLEHDDRRGVGHQFKAHRTRPMLFALAAQLRADVEQVHRMQLDDGSGQGHGARHLQKAAQPAVGQIDLFLAQARIGAGLHVEACRIELQPRVLVVADFLELFVQRGRVVDVGRAALHLARMLERRMLDADRAIARLVLTESLEQQAIRVHGDHRIEHIPEVLVVLVQPFKVLALRGVERFEQPVSGGTQCPQLGADLFQTSLCAAGVGHETGQQLRLMFRKPLQVCGLVAAARAHVAHHHIVQRGQSFAHLQISQAIALQSAIESHGRPEQIGRERERLRSRRVADVGRAVVLVSKFHCRPQRTGVALLR